MAPLSEVLSMLHGQAFGKTVLPNIDFTGKTIIITGANTGLGLECAKHLSVPSTSPINYTLTLNSARKNASHIVLACRNDAKGQVARTAILHETNCEAHTTISVWPLNLANYASVLSFAARVRTELPRLDAFLANAGMESHAYEEAEGIEMYLLVNVVSMFMSAIAILPKLRQTAQDHDVETTLTFCGSMYHIFGSDEEFDVGMAEDVDMFDTLSTEDPSKTNIEWRYALSKLMVHQCFHELIATLAKNDEHSSVVVNLINPGWCGTELSRVKPHPFMEKVSFAVMGWTAEKGSRMYIFALAAGRESHGKYLAESQVKIESRYVRSQRGRNIQSKMWRDLMARISQASPEVAGYIS
jgi:retinol dehydrogenase-12